jgi:hypothetical protein
MDLQLIIAWPVKIIFTLMLQLALLFALMDIMRISLIILVKAVCSGAQFVPISANAFNVVLILHCPRPFLAQII